MTMAEITESTKIRFSLLITILGLIMGSAGAGVWWAATINYKVNILLDVATTQRDAVKENTQQIIALEKTIQKVELQFSVLQSRVTALEAKTGNGNNNHRPTQP